MRTATWNTIAGVSPGQLKPQCSFVQQLSSPLTVTSVLFCPWGLLSLFDIRHETAECIIGTVLS